jgi:hypothetical protein
MDYYAGSYTAFAKLIRSREQQNDRSYGEGLTS